MFLKDWLKNRQLKKRMRDGNHRLPAKTKLFTNDFYRKSATPLRICSIDLFMCVCVCVYIYIQLIYLFMAALGLCCCMLSLVATKRGYSPGAVRGLLTAVASAVVEHGSRTCGLSSYGTWAECSIACGIFLDQGSNSHFLHWQVDSLPLSHQGSPGLFISLAFQ